MKPYVGSRAAWRLLSRRPSRGRSMNERMEPKNFDQREQAASPGSFPSAAGYGRIRVTMKILD